MMLPRRHSEPRWPHVDDYPTSKGRERKGQTPYQIVIRLRNGLNSCYESALKISDGIGKICVALAEDEKGRRPEALCEIRMRLREEILHGDRQHTCPDVKSILRLGRRNELGDSWRSNQRLHA